MSYFSDALILVAIAETVNDLGNPVSADTQTTVFANKKSVRQSEVYQAAAAGLKPELMFEVNTDEYTQQAFATWNSKRYKVIRAYSREDGITELILQGVTNGVI
jgi:SPP1 family predicted phage head-tail adaptor